MTTLLYILYNCNGCNDVVCVCCFRIKELREMFDHVHRKRELFHQCLVSKGLFAVFITTNRWLFFLILL